MLLLVLMHLNTNAPPEEKGVLLEEQSRFSVQEKLLSPSLASYTVQRVWLVILLLS